VTVAALVAPAIQDEVGENNYNICLEPTCDVVYYNAGERYFVKAELAIRVAFKEPGGPRTVCYCHDLTEADIVDLAGRNGHAKSFVDVAAILGVSNCMCEERHPFGGNCACAGEVGRVIKFGLAKTSIREEIRQVRPPRVFIYDRENSCCGTNISASLVAFLQRRFDSRIDVRKFDLTARKDSVPVSTALLDLFRRERANALPAMVIEGEVVTSGQLPTLLDAVEFVEARLKTWTTVELTTTHQP